MYSNSTELQSCQLKLLNSSYEVPFTLDSAIPYASTTDCSMFQETRI